MSLFLAIIFGGLGTTFGRLGAQSKSAANPGTPTGDGTMDFSNPDDSALVALLEDI